MARTPVQIIVARDHGDPMTEPYVDALRLAFEGAVAKKGRQSTYLADSVDLGIHVLDPPGLARKGIAVTRILDAAEQSVLVDIRSTGKRRPAALNSNVTTLMSSKETVSVVKAVIPPPKATDTHQLRETEIDREVEDSLLPTVTAIRAMDCAREALSSRISPAKKKHSLRFFLSHAKIDGVPMALSIVSLMERFARNPKTRGTFYDVRDIPRGANWRKILEQNAGRCVLIALRTEEYESRHWCRREYLWAERNGVPILVVDLRTNPYHALDRLPFGPAPTVRVQDGNLIRIVFHALACHLRHLRLERRVALVAGNKTLTEVLGRHPSEFSLHGAVQRIRRRAGRRKTLDLKIVYPPPTADPFYLEAVTPMLGAASPKISLVAIDDL